MLRQCFHGALYLSLATGLRTLSSKETPTYELKVNRNVATGTCEHARIRATQHHRLLDQPRAHAHEVVTTRRHAQSEDDRAPLELISMFAHDEEVLRRELELLCGGIDMYVLAGAQAVLSSSLDVEAEVPPLDVRLISGSGSSNNRVDLTFFSDGCKCIPTPDIVYTDVCADTHIMQI